LSTLLRPEIVRRPFLLWSACTWKRAVQEKRKRGRTKEKRGELLIIPSFLPFRDFRNKGNVRKGEEKEKGKEGKDPQPLSDPALLCGRESSSSDALGMVNGKRREKKKERGRRKRNLSSISSAIRRGSCIVRRKERGREKKGKKKEEKGGGGRLISRNSLPTTSLSLPSRNWRGGEGKRREGEKKKRKKKGGSPISLQYDCSRIRFTTTSRFREEGKKREKKKKRGGKRSRQGSSRAERVAAAT